MMAALDRMNLRPFEKRLVVGVAAFLFIVINVWLVLPYFGELTKVQGRMEDAQKKLKRYNTEISQIPKLERLVKQLEGEGLAVPLEDQALHFSTAIQSQAAASGVGIQQTGRLITRTNLYFLEQSQTIATLSGEQQLVDFLYNLGAGNSLIRVRDLALRPDPPRQALSANIKLAANYQKKAPVKGATTPAPTPAPKTTPSVRPSTPATSPGSQPPARPANPAAKPPPSSQPAKPGQSTDKSSNFKQPEP